jgi:RNA polymerase-binding protein DksA
MDTIKIRKYQERLLNRRQEILSTLGRLMEESRELSGERFFDWLDQAQDESAGRLLRRLTDTYMQELEKIDIALRRMLDGGYGLCVACGRSIESRRLDIFPAADFCWDCQGMREEFERV